MQENIIVVVDTYLLPLFKRRKVLMNKTLEFIKSILIPVILGGIVGLIISNFMDYDIINKPPLSPPDILSSVPSYTTKIPPFESNVPLDTFVVTLFSSGRLSPS